MLDALSPLSRRTNCCIYCSVTSAAKSHQQVQSPSRNQDIPANVRSVRRLIKCVLLSSGYGIGRITSSKLITVKKSLPNVMLCRSAHCVFIDLYMSSFQCFPKLSRNFGEIDIDDAIFVLEVLVHHCAFHLHH